MKFNIRHTHHIRLNIVELTSGKLVDTIHYGEYPKGKYIISWDGFLSNSLKINKGIYVINLMADNILVLKEKIVNY